MKTTVKKSSETTKVQQLNAVAKAAKNEVKSLSIMYFVNQLNKLAKRNEYVNGVNVRQLGKLLQQYAGTKELFSAYAFERDFAGRPSVVAAYNGDVDTNGLHYGDIVTDKGRELRIYDSGDGVVIYKPVALSLPGLISAYKEVLKPLAAATDKAAREAAKAAKAAEREAAKDAVKAQRAVKEIQRQAVADFQAGKIDLCELAKVLKTA